MKEKRRESIIQQNGGILLNLFSKVVGYPLGGLTFHQGPKRVISDAIG